MRRRAPRTMRLDVGVKAGVNVVEQGVFFDVLIAVLIAGIYTNRLQDAFDSVDTSHLTVLKE